MEITEIRIKLMEGSEDRLRAFCSVTIDNAFVVRDLKIIDGSSGPFVAMPSRKLTGHCQRCSHKNYLRATYCNHCGIKLQLESSDHYDSPQKLYADVAHPINSECRELIQNAVITEFDAELSRCQQPGYRSRYDDDFGYEDVDADDVIAGQTPSSKSSPARSQSAVSGPAKDVGESGPPRPHFIDNPRTPKETAGGEQDQDGFGAGVFG
jgi:stage V sporulation protein G